MGEKNLIVDDEESMPDLICNNSEKDTKNQDILFEIRLPQYHWL